jgi:hypothetical protein
VDSKETVWTSGTAIDEGGNTLIYDENSNIGRNTLTPEDRVFIQQSLPETIEFGAPQFSYWNCQQLVLADNSLTYVEGYALHADVGFPISHAWLLAPDGYAIDPTWDSPGCYFGVPLSTTWVESVLAARNHLDNLSIFDGNYIEKFSLLKEGLPVDAFANLLR